MPEPLREHPRFLGSPGTASFLHRCTRDEPSSTSIWLRPILCHEGSSYPPIKIASLTLRLSCGRSRLYYGRAVSFSLLLDIPVNHILDKTNNLSLVIRYHSFLY